MSVNVLTLHIRFSTWFQISVMLVASWICEAPLNIKLCIAHCIVHRKLYINRSLMLSRETTMREQIGSIQPTTAGTALLVIPASVAQDSAFPFNIHEKVKVRIEGNKLVVEKVE